MPDGGGKGHFTTMAEIRESLLDHERRIRMLERDVPDLADFVGDVATTAPKRRARKRRRKPVMKP